MKSKILTTVIFLLSLSIYGQSNPNFTLHTNGVTCLCPNADIGETGDVNGVTYTKRTRDQITTDNAGTTCTSGITDMSSLFGFSYDDRYNSFNQNISSWDVSNVTNMSNLFKLAYKFNQPIGNWHVRNVTNMSGMFSETSAFNQPIGNWDVSNVTNMSNMFNKAYVFNQPIDTWDVSNVTNMSNMFSYANVFNQPIGDWDVSNVTNMSSLFSNSKVFNKSINTWDVSNVTNMSYMFLHAKVFNQPIGNWDVSSVNDMHGMFYWAIEFNQPIGNWHVRNVTDMSYMFSRGFAFNQPISNWDVSSVTNMNSMFSQALVFNQPIGNWHVRNVTNMSYMFQSASTFNQDISTWCVGHLPKEPLLFSAESSLKGKNMPVWGYCTITNDFTIDPNQGFVGQELEITIVGGENSFNTSMTDTKAVTIFNDLQQKLTVNSTTQTSANELKVAVTIPEGATTGLYSIEIHPLTNVTHSSTVNNIFTVTSGLSTQDFQFDSDIHLYPNPINDVLNIETSNGLEVGQIDIYNNLGELILTFENSQNNHFFNLSQLLPSVYILKLTTNKGVKTSKIVKI